MVRRKIPFGPVSAQIVQEAHAKYLLAEMPVVYKRCGSWRRRGQLSRHNTGLTLLRAEGKEGLGRKSLQLKLSQPDLGLPVRRVPVRQDACSRWQCLTP